MCYMFKFIQNLNSFISWYCSFFLSQSLSDMYMLKEFLSEKNNALRFFYVFYKRELALAQKAI